MFSSPIQSFLVFDGYTSKEEGAEPVLFFAKHFSVTPPHYAVNQAGIFLTLLKFSHFFNREQPMEYALTDKNETSILELHDNIWMTITQAYSKTTNRHLLHEILVCCKKIYNLFFPLPQRDKYGKVTKNSCRSINSVFEMILMAITKTNLTFIHLFDSFFQLDPKKEIMDPLTPIINEILNQNSPISHIAIMHSRNFLYSNFPVEVTRTLAICLHIKLPYLFPQVLAKDDERLYWIIGLSRSESGPLNVYAPPIVVNGEQLPLVALRFKKIRIILSLKKDLVPTPELLHGIPRILKPLKFHFNNLIVESVYGRFNGSYIVIINDKSKRMLQLSNQRISDATIPIAESNIIMAYLFARQVGPSSQVAFTGTVNHFIFFNTNYYEKEVIVLCKTETREISKSLSIIGNLLEPANIQMFKIKNTK